MDNAESYVLFELAGSAYAIPSQVVQRMELVEQVTPVPNAPSFIDGIVFSRGVVVPALNLRSRFGFERAPYDSKTRLIVAALDERIVGLIVDSAREFISIPADAIKPTPSTLAATSGKYLSGIATLNGKVLLLLDIKEVLVNAAAVGTPVSAQD